MEIKNLSLPVSAVPGAVSAILTLPDKPICILTLAHGAGANMHHAFMEALATSLAGADIATLRFNFPFTEQEKKRPDAPAVAQQAIAAAIDRARELYPALPLFVAGKSFGGRMSSQLLAAQHRKEVTGLIFYGFPLHAAGKPSIDRAAHLQLVKVPMLFLQGTKDTLATWDMIEAVCKSLKKATLVKLERADHSFKAGKNKDMIPVITAATRDWVKKKIK